MPDLGCESAAVSRRLEVAPWVAHRTYRPGGEEWRILLSNERDHEFLVLEGASAGVWASIQGGHTAEEIVRVAAPDVAAELPHFIGALLECGLLVYADEAASHVRAAPPPPPLPFYVS